MLVNDDKTFKKIILYGIELLTNRTAEEDDAFSLDIMEMDD